MKPSKYREIQNLIAEYGDATKQLLDASKWMSARVVSEFPEFLGCDKKHITGVPPFGEFDPKIEYRGASRSSYYEPVSFLDPVKIGICTQIQNLHDQGATWVRSVIHLTKSGSTLVAHVGETHQKVVLSDQEDADLTKIFEALHEDIRNAFEAELHEASAQKRIGFIPQTVS